MASWHRPLLFALAAPALIAAQPPPPKPKAAPATAAAKPRPSAAATPAPRRALIPIVAAPARPPLIVLPPPPPLPPRVMPAISTAQEKQLRDFLRQADAHGIVAHAPTAATAAMPAAGDTATLVQAALDTAQALHSGRLAASDYRDDWGMRPAYYDPWSGFVAAVRADRLPAWFASLPPPYTGYDALRKGLAAYRAIDAAGGWRPVAASADLKPGGSGEAVAALRARLAIEDRAVEARGTRYDGDLVDAVRRAQRRYGLEPTGLANAVTLAALNVPAGDRVRQITANMERWRWLPPELPTHRIQVNIATAVLSVFEADSPVTSMRAVTGRPGDETPMLQSQVHSVVFNPPWNVPTSIATKELWPKEKAHPGYLKRNGFKVIETPDGGRRLQQSSERSALGKVKFDFDNPYGVYLHDTPTQGTFDRNARLASHGCVRLAHPVDLAKLVFEGDAKWTPEAIDDAIAKGDTVRARLSDPIAVFLFYWTAFGGGDGAMSFRGDPYGWDAVLADRIDAGAKRAPFAVAAK